MDASISAIIGRTALEEGRGRGVGGRVAAFDAMGRSDGHDLLDSRIAYGVSQLVWVVGHAQGVAGGYIAVPHSPRDVAWEVWLRPLLLPLTAMWVFPLWDMHENGISSEA